MMKIIVNQNGVRVKEYFSVNEVSLSVEIQFQLLIINFRRKILTELNNIEIQFVNKIFFILKYEWKDIVKY